MARDNLTLYTGTVNDHSPPPDAALLRKYRIRVATFLAGTVVCVAFLSTIYRTINTIYVLNAVESERDQWQRASDVIAALKLNDGDVVADVGSGAGYFALRLSPVVGLSGKVVAIDIRRQPLMFLWMRTVLDGRHNVREVIAGPDDPHLPVGSINAVLIANTYHEFAHPEWMLEHVFTSLRSGGRLVVVDRSSAAQDSDAGQNHHHEILPEPVDRQLRQKGFHILERQDRFIDRPTGERWWMIVARKT